METLYKLRRRVALETVAQGMESVMPGSKSDCKQEGHGGDNFLSLRV